MEFGIHLPQVGPLAGREAVLAVARRCQELGFHSLWVSDHVVVPRQIGTRYPGQPDGRFPVPPEAPFLEPVSTLLFVAAATERIKLGTSILVITMRNPVLTAKMLATLDVLSNGRLIFGAGEDSLDGMIAEANNGFMVESLMGAGQRQGRWVGASLWTPPIYFPRLSVSGKP